MALRPTTGNAVLYLEDGDEAYPAMLAAIDRAQSTVHLEAYIFEGDLVGWRFARRLAAAARRGVTVRLVVDALGSYRLPSALLDYLASAGVSVERFNPLHFAGWTLLRRRDHRKLLAIDARIAFIGGLNITLDHVPEPLGKSWHDALVCIDGPAAIDVDNSFCELHLRAPRRAQPQTTVNGLGRCWLLRNGFLDDRYVIRRRYLHAIRHAQKDIAIANAYFLPDRRILRALRHAALRGVRVRLLLPGLSDMPLIKTAIEAAYGRYLRWGIELREWPGNMLHHKMAVFDRASLCIGSYNLDNLSLRKNLEISVWIDRSAAVEQATSAYERDWDASRTVVPSETRRSLWRRAAAWLALRLD